MAKAKRPPLAVRAPRDPDAFVSGASENSRQPSTVSRQPSVAGAPRMRGVVSRAGGKEAVKVTAYLDVETATSLKRYCFDKGLEISAVAGEAIVAFVQKL